MFLRNVASKGLSELANTCVMIFKPSKLPFHFAFLLVFHLYAVLNATTEFCDLACLKTVSEIYKNKVHSWSVLMTRAARMEFKYAP